MSIQAMRERNQARERAARLQRELSAARAALKPFAVAARCAEDDEKDSYSLAFSSARHELTIGNLRRAAKVLNG